MGDLIGNEARLLREGIKNNAWPNGGSAEEFVRRTSLYEALSEVPARVLGVIARWGNDDEFRAGVELMLSYAETPSEGGTVVFIGLKTYPAVLMMYALGMGSIAASRYDRLFRMLKREIRARYNSGSASLVTELFGHKWSANEDNAWNFLPEFKGTSQKLSLSEHLLRLFREWATDFSPVEDVTEGLFNRFEMLAVLAYLTVTVDKTDIQRALNDSAGDNYVVTPVGRIFRLHSKRQDIVREWKDADTLRRLLDAGFARGDPEYLDLAVSNIDRIAGRWFWR
jgi:hypothetical protein